MPWSLACEKLMSNWPKHLLRAAAIHCSAWGLFIIALPTMSATVYGFDRPLTDVFLWKGSGLILLLFGLGYGIASRDPLRHWAMVFVGLVAKVLGPIGMALSVWTGEVSPRVLILIPFNDILWWIPMALIIKSAVCSSQWRETSGEQRVGK